MVNHKQNVINSDANQASGTVNSECQHNVRKLRPVYRLAKQHCANWDRRGCEGADVDPKTGRHFRWRAAGSFCLLALGGRCPYFESTILSLAKRRERDWPATTFAPWSVFQKAVRLYHECFPEVAAPPILESTPGGQAGFEREMARRSQLDKRKCLVCGKRSAQPGEQPCPRCRSRQGREASMKVPKDGARVRIGRLQSA